MLVRVLTIKVVTFFCLLILVAFGQGNANAQVDWGRVLDLSPRNTETKPERPSLSKELELGRQIREQNQRSQPDYPGRQDNRSNSTGRGASVAGPQIEMRGVFEGYRSERPDRPDRDSGSNQSSERVQQGRRSYDERFVPIYGMPPNRNMAGRTAPGARGPWGTYNTNRQQWWRQPPSPARQALRIVGRQAWEEIKREWADGERRAKQWYQDRQNAQQRYHDALRREGEANRRAAHAEWSNPYSPEARSLRQAANQASMERARAQLGVYQRDQNDMRYIYGNRFSPVPNRQQWIRPRRQ